MAKIFPEHWHQNTWEDKAKENPLNAIMTSEQMLDADANDFSEEHLELFFRKGVKLFKKHIEPHIKNLPDKDQNPLFVEYGCGAGRILKAIIDAGYACSGIDISETMLGHCRRLVPSVKDLYLLDEHGRINMPSESASMVFSNAVVQHIESLNKYITAFDEMCRVLKPGGTLAVQVNCEDYVHGDINTPWKTENFETYSLHYKPGKSKHYSRHDQDMWSGVYIGEQRLRDELKQRGVIIENHYYRDDRKPRAIWFTGRKIG